MESYFEWANEEEIDEFIKNLGEQILEEDSKTAIINPHRMMQMDLVHKIALYLTKNTNANVTYEVNKPFKSMGSVTIEANDFVFSDTKWFSRAIELSSNVEIYPLTNGMIRLTFTFHGITTPIE